MDLGSTEGQAGAHSLQLPPRTSWENEGPLLELPRMRSSFQDSQASASGNPGLLLDVPHTSQTFEEIITASGTYRDGDLAINLAGLRMGISDAPNVDSGPMAFADLQLMRVLGRGSSAVVQLVQHKRTNKIYALKEIQMRFEEPERNSIRNELQINQARREHVVECHQTFYSDGRISIVLEYMDGGSLADILKHKGKIGEAHLAAISKQALLGLLSLHRDHIIHRDIKPSNMLMNKKGEVKISDFGVSTLLTSTLDLGQTFVGTYTYMSPERISCETYSYNSDTWALGLSILECAVGHFPYLTPHKGPWKNFFELLTVVATTPSPEAPEGQFSPEFCSFIEDCLQKKPSERSTVSQLLEHPFVKKYEGSEVNIGELCNHVQ